MSIFVFCLGKILTLLPCILDVEIIRNNVILSIKIYVMMKQLLRSQHLRFKFRISVLFYIKPVHRKSAPLYPVLIYLEIQVTHQWLLGYYERISGRMNGISANAFQLLVLQLDTIICSSCTKCVLVIRIILSFLMFFLRDLYF